MLALLLVALAAADPAITSVAGTGEKGFAGDGGPADLAKLDQPFDVAVDPAGNLYFTDTFNHRVRRVDAKSGTIKTVAGSGRKGFDGDGGRATDAALNEPYGLAVDAAGTVYFADRLNACVRRVDGRTGIITTVAGVGGKPGSGADAGPAAQTPLREPNGVALDRPSAPRLLFITDVADQRLRAVALDTGKVVTMAGNGLKRTAGDGGPVKDATFAGPRAVAVGPTGRVFVVEREGNCVRVIDPKAGTIDRFAGTGKKGYTGDGGPAKAATFDGPKEIDVDREGNVYVVDTENEVVRRIDARTGIITTVAGNGKTKTPGLGDGGPATAATLGRPHGVAVGPAGVLYIADTNGHRVRRVK
ncbi:MAG: hypothetical protein K2X82_14405 [Gemmataceae bacterium]|nr:hypothetical protein [Gemmataceae bacterium]